MKTSDRFDSMDGSEGRITEPEPYPASRWLQETEMPLGTPGMKCHFMPEAYYERWEMLLKAERRAWKRGTGWLKASQRLRAHENTHCTD